MNKKYLILFYVKGEYEFQTYNSYELAMSDWNNPDPSWQPLYLTEIILDNNEGGDE